MTNRGGPALHYVHIATVMKEKLPTKPARRPQLIRPLRDFLHAEAAGGVVVVIAAIVAIGWANSTWSHGYQALWLTNVQASAGRFSLSMDLRHWVNDGLMTVFFLIVGLEIKRESVEGELRDRRKSIVPAAAAIGGMIVPALIYGFVNAGAKTSRGWGIPMATDIALSVGILALAGSSFPAGAKLFLLALAIVDDVGAIIVIAVFYGSGSRPLYLGLAVAVVVIVVFVQRRSVMNIYVYIVLGVMLWWTLHQAGVHATLAGVVMGLLAPTKPVRSAELIDVDELSDLSDLNHAMESVRIARESVSVVEWLEHRLHPWTGFVVVPIFALANAGVDLRQNWESAMHSRTAWGVILGLVIGKPVGILLASFIAVHRGWGTLPSDTNWRHIGAVAAVAGTGFTVSLLVAELALSGSDREYAKAAVLVASMAAAIIGLVLARTSHERARHTNRS